MFAFYLYHYIGVGSVIHGYLNNLVLLNIRKHPTLIPVFIFLLELLYV
jgi:hypothetical protein